jgi:hypothetical protein
VETAALGPPVSEGPRPHLGEAGFRRLLVGRRLQDLDPVAVGIDHFELAAPRRSTGSLAASLPRRRSSA